MEDSQVEQALRAKGLTAPRITPADLQGNIVYEAYFTAMDGVRGADRGGTHFKAGHACKIDALNLLTFCVLILKNGFTVTGESACASPENFDADMGRKIARQNAERKIWPLMGYALKSRLQIEDNTR